MSNLRLFLFGPPRLTRASDILNLQYRKNLALVAYLAMMGGVHSRETLIALLWPEAEPTRARADLRRNLSLLKKALAGEWLTVEGEIINAKQTSDLWLDVAEFHRLLSTCTTHGHRLNEVCPSCIPLLEEAVALYCQEFMAGFSLIDSVEFDEWQLFQSESLRSELSIALERLVRACSASGEFERAIIQAQRWLTLDYLHEPAWCWLMQLYAWSGKRTAALHKYKECERVLKRELGMDPELETTRLYQSIQKNQYVAPSISYSKTQPRHNLPAQRKPFLGRTALITQLEDQLQDKGCQLVTLVGPGGCGKTQLALEVGNRQLDSFEHGVYFISLAPLQSVETMIPTICREIGVTSSDGGDPYQQLLNYLYQKQMLLILDNFEHLLAGIEFISEILSVAPRLKVLVTTRVCLNLQEENLIYVEGLEYPTWESFTDASNYDAVRLFIYHARRINPDQVLENKDLRFIVQICQLVKGIPLAILLAASWVKLLSPAEIAKEIEKGLEILETDLVDLPERQRSMRATFDYSWNLLTKAEQRKFQAFSVFNGGFSRQAAEQVVGADFRDLRGFINKSLLYRTSTGRYEMHELLRQYASEQLSAAPEEFKLLCERHAAFYATSLERWSAEIKGPNQKLAYTEARAELENLRIAGNWAVSQASIEFFFKTAEAICWFPGFLFSNQEALAICTAAINILSGIEVSSQKTNSYRSRVLVRLLAGQSYLAGICGNRREALSAFDQACTLLASPELADQDTRLERAIAILFGTLWILSPREDVLASFKESMVLFQDTGEYWWAAMTQAYLGKLMVDWFSYNLGKQLLEKSLDTQRSLSDQLAISYTLRWLSAVHWSHGSLEVSEQLARENLSINQELGNQFGIRIALSSLGESLISQGRFNDAYQVLGKSIEIFGDLKPNHENYNTNEFISLVEVHIGHYQIARLLIQDVLERQRNANQQWLIGFSNCILSMVAQTEKNWVESQRLLQEAQLLFRELNVMDFLAWALALLGYTERQLNQPALACQHLAETLLISVDQELFIAPLYALPVIALLLGDQGNGESAMELHALAWRYGYVSNSRWFDEIFGQEIAMIAATLPPDIGAVARERGKAADIAESIQELLKELSGWFNLGQNVNGFKQG